MASTHLLYVDNYYTILNRIFVDLGYDVNNGGLYRAIKDIKEKHPKSVWMNIISSISFIVATDISLLQELGYSHNVLPILCHSHEEKVADKLCYTNMTLESLLMIIELIENNDIEYTEKFKAHIINLAENFPKIFFYDSKRINKFSFIALNHNDTDTVQNTRDNILFLTDLNDLERRLAMTFLTHKYDMFNISMRLFIPYYTIDNIFKTELKYSDLNISYYTPLIYNHQAISDTPSYRKSDILDKYLSMSNSLIYFPNNYKFMSPSTICNCFINCSLSTLKQLVRFCEDEYDSNNPILSNIYYYIMDMKLAYPNIYNAIKYDNADAENILIKNLSR